MFTLLKLAFAMLKKRLETRPLSKLLPGEICGRIMLWIKFRAQKLRKILLHGFKDFCQIFHLRIFTNFKKFLCAFAAKSRFLGPPKKTRIFSIVLRNFAKYFSRGIFLQEIIISKIPPDIVMFFFQIF